MSPRQPAPRIAVPDAIDPAALRGFDPAAPVVTCSGATMGTRWQVHAALPPVLGLDAAMLGARIQARLDGIVADMSHWEQTSHLCRFNRAHAGSRIALSPDLAAVIADALEIAAASQGAFDPSLGRLTDIWGLGPWKRERDPTAREIAIARAASGWQRLAFDPGHRILRQPGGLWLDLSGIAKGFAVDAVADLLARHGVHHVLVEIGGELAGRGLRPDGDPWWVDIEDPPGLSLPRLRIALHQLSVATSGDYLRGAHTIDPRTGRPAIHDTTAVTVLHPCCMRADGWATALGTVPFAAARQMACDHALIARIVLRDGTEWISPALAAMMEGADAAAA
jgi:thiamine biosynthesis lipoprotein